MYRKPHHKFLQNFPMVDVSQVVTCVSSQISERVTGEGSFAKGFAMSSNSQYAIKKIFKKKNNKKKIIKKIYIYISFRPNGSYKSIHLTIIRIYFALVD